VDPHRVVDVLQPFDLGVLEDLDTQREAGTFETPHQSRGVDEGRAVDVEERAFVRGGVNAGLDLFAVEHLHVVAHLVAQPCLFDHSLELPWRDRDAQFAGAFPVALDLVALDGRFDLVEVLASESFDDGHLVREAVHAIVEPVRE